MASVPPPGGKPTRILIERGVSARAEPAASAASASNAQTHRSRRAMDGADQRSRARHACRTSNSGTVACAITRVATEPRTAALNAP